MQALATIIQSRGSRFVIRVPVVIIRSMKIRRSVRCRIHRSRLSCSTWDTIQYALARIAMEIIRCVTSIQP